MSALAKGAAKIKVSKRLDSIEDASFFKKKMEKAEKLLAVARLPVGLPSQKSTNTPSFEVDLRNKCSNKDKDATYYQTLRKQFI